MSDELKQNISRTETWIRLLYMMLFAVIYSFAGVVLGAIVLLQFGFVLFTATRNPHLLRVGASMSLFLYQILLYITYNTDERPFPFSEWPVND